MTDVQKSLSGDNLRKAGVRVLCDLLQQPPPPDSLEPSSGDIQGLFVKSISAAGDVQHIFSHIKKTYRVQRIVLEGGTTLPELLCDYRPYEGLRSGKILHDDNLRWCSVDDLDKEKCESSLSILDNVANLYFYQLEHWTNEDLEESGQFGSVGKISKIEGLDSLT